MSLIHDALKKAEGGENPPVGSGLSQFQEPIEEAGKKIPLRTIVLAVVTAFLNTAKKDEAVGNIGQNRAAVNVQCSGGTSSRG